MLCVWAVSVWIWTSAAQCLCSAISIYEVWKNTYANVTWHVCVNIKSEKVHFSIFIWTGTIRVMDFRSKTYMKKRLSIVPIEQKTRLFTMNLFSVLTCITETVFPREKRELTSNCNRHLIIKSLCTSIWKTCHCFPTANYWSISSVSGQC